MDVGLCFCKRYLFFLSFGLLFDYEWLDLIRGEGALCKFG